MATGEGTDIAYSGLFFVFFVALLALPPLAGKAADVAGTARPILWVVAGLLVLSVILFMRVLHHLR
jgi:hypothetical protein